jgi:hypothetical protein
MTRRELALRSFWSNDPLCQLYEQANRSCSFTLRQLIDFAEGLSDSAFAAVRGADGSQPSAPCQTRKGDQSKQARRPVLALIQGGRQ